ncbi:hypothetical protein JCM6882_003937 [Rhodosporidiobolus microsporus]
MPSFSSILLYIRARPAFKVHLNLHTDLDRQSRSSDYAESFDTETVWSDDGGFQYPVPAPFCPTSAIGAEDVSFIQAVSPPESSSDTSSDTSSEYDWSGWSITNFPMDPALDKNAAAPLAEVTPATTPATTNSSSSFSSRRTGNSFDAPPFSNLIRIDEDGDGASFASSDSPRQPTQFTVDPSSSLQPTKRRLPRSSSLVHLRSRVATVITSSRPTTAKSHRSQMFDDLLRESGAVDLAPVSSFCLSYSYLPGGEKRVL